MKLLSTAAAALLAGSTSTTAFAPAASSQASITNRGAASCQSTTCLPMALPFFAQEDTKEKEEEPSTPIPSTPTAPSSSIEPDNAVIAEALTDAAKADAKNAELDALTMEEEVEMLVQAELNKTKRMSNLRNEKGVEYAPWMGISEADETKIRNLMRDRTEARRKRQEEAQDVSGNLFRDSQAQELSGTGLSYKIIDGEVELQWATKSESDTKGFLVKRRAAKTNDYETIATHETYGPLVSKGREGGVYRYLDSTADPGGWVYRISEEDNFGNQADVCQCLVEVETEDEARAAVIAGVGFAVFAVLVVLGGVALDPMNGY